MKIDLLRRTTVFSVSSFSNVPFINYLKQRKFHLLSKRLQVNEKIKGVYAKCTNLLENLQNVRNLILDIDKNDNGNSDERFRAVKFVLSEVN